MSAPAEYFWDLIRASIRHAKQGNEPLDHYLIVALWTLPLTMMLAGAIHIPLAPLVLAAFAARLIWQLAREEAGEHGNRAVPALGASAKLQRAA